MASSRCWNIQTTPDLSRTTWRQVLNKIPSICAYYSPGLGILGIPDRLNPEYTEYFVTFNVEERTETYATTLTNIIIPEGNRLEVRVDDVVSWIWLFEQHLILFNAIRYGIRSSRQRLLPLISTTTAPSHRPVLPVDPLLNPKHFQLKESPGFKPRLRNAQGTPIFILTEERCFRMQTEHNFGDLWLKWMPHFTKLCALPKLLLQKWVELNMRFKRLTSFRKYRKEQ